jgi:hypothetical protein
VSREFSCPDPIPQWVSSMRRGFIESSYTRSFLDLGAPNDAGARGAMRCAKPARNRHAGDLIARTGASVFRTRYAGVVVSW